MGGLAEVLAAHAKECASDACEACECGWAIDEFRTADYVSGIADHAAHVEAAVLAWLDDLLGGDEAREAVAEVEDDAHWCESNYTSGCNCKDDRLRRAAAALAEVRALVGSVGGAAEATMEGDAK